MSPVASASGSATIFAIRQTCKKIKMERLTSLQLEGCVSQDITVAKRV